MANHTPGPWNVESGGNIVAPRSHAISAGFTVASVDTFTGNRTATAQEREANARLIAAAPELLEACRAAAEWLPLLHDALTDEQRAEWTGDGCPLFQLRAALAKATAAP